MLLQNAGIQFRVVPPDLDEAAFKTTHGQQNSSIADMALGLAIEKATLVSRVQPGALVVGADQMLEANGIRYDKASDLDELRQHLRQLRDKTHQLVSAIAVCQAGELQFSHVGTARLHMRNFSDRFLELYLERVGDQALGQVGGYAVEGQGVQLFEKIEGEQSVILGLPMLPLLEFLRRADMMPQ